MDRELRTSIAVREALDFKKKLDRNFVASQLSMIVVLGVMAYFDVSVKWIVIIGFWLATGTISYILKECAARLDAGRAYLEMWSNDAGDVLDRIDDRVRATSSWGG